MMSDFEGYEYSTVLAPLWDSSILERRFVPNNVIDIYGLYVNAWAIFHILRKDLRWKLLTVKDAAEGFTLQLDLCKEALTVS